MNKSKTKALRPYQVGKVELINIEPLNILYSFSVNGELDGYDYGGELEGEDAYWVVEE